MKVANPMPRLTEFDGFSRAKRSPSQSAAHQDRKGRGCRQQEEPKRHGEIPGKRKICSRRGSTSFIPNHCQSTIHCSQIRG
jgi:hypothetical protein